MQRKDLRILIVHEIDYYGSAVFEFQEFSEAIQELGHEVIVLDLKERSRKGNAHEAKHNRRLKKARTTKDRIKVKTPWLMIPNDAFRPLAVFVHLFALSKIFIFQKPDVVLSYSVPTSGPTVAVLGRLFRVPVVHRAIDVSHKLRPGRFDLVVKLAEKLTFMFSTHISTHNKALAEYAENKGATEKNISIHYPPVDLNHFSTDGERALPPPTRIIFVGTLSHFTGLEHVFRVAGQYRGEHEWNLKVVGDGVERENLEAYCSKLSLDDRVSFVGWKDYEDLGKELEWANVAIVPFTRDLLTDCALPQKTVQYMAAGLPVVSTALKGSVAEFGDLDGIHFVETPGDVFEASFAASLGKRPGGESFISRFDKQNAIKEMVTYLEGLVASRKYDQKIQDTQD